MLRNVRIGLVLVAALAGSARAQTVLHVDTNATNEPHDGSSWCHAYLTLHKALAAVEVEAVIRVADGTYLPDTSGLADPRAATFGLISGVTIEGGYAGCGAPDPDARDIVLYETILSGDIGTPGDPSDNCYHVVTSADTDETAILDGVTITGGNADGWTYDDRQGGGMYSYDADPTLINCTFSGNAAQDNGGAMYNFGSSPTLVGCTFRDNSATDGAGIFNDNHCNPTLTDCTFAENTVVYFGAGMYNRFHSSPTVTRCTFSDNTASSGSGGGMYNHQYCDATVTKCVFSGNRVLGYGGGVFSDASDPTLADCTFSGNTADHYGGGVCNDWRCNATLVNCTFSGNTAEFGGAVCNLMDAAPTISNCTFIRNTATLRGGGIRNHTDGTPVVIGCTFSGNTAVASGGGIDSWGSNPLVIDCVLVGNTAYRGGAIRNFDEANPTVINCTLGYNAATYGGGMYSEHECRPVLTNCIVWGNVPDQIIEAPGCPTTVTYTCIVDGWIGEGNLDADPAFVRSADPGPDGVWGTEDDDYGDLHLTRDSPCIDAGDPNYAPQFGETDLDGHPRILCNRVDMGPYEFGIGDYDCDRDVDADDFAQWGCMTGPDAGPYSPGCEAFDFDADADVDLEDFEGFQRAFTGEL